MKINTILILLISLLMFSCKFENNKEKQKNQNSVELNKEVTLQENIDNKKVKVLNETKNDSLRKVVVNIELTEKIKERELNKIAKKIRKFEDKDKYDKIWIFYFINGTKEGSGAWATTHYSPDLEIKILGATAKEEEKSKNTLDNVQGEIIGKWYEEQYTSSSIVLYKKNGIIQAKTIFKNGQEMFETLQEQKVSNGTKYFDKNNGQGEYFIVLKSGDLGFYNKENKQFTFGKPIK
ncbi:MAG: hypothetical protein JST62_08935 [Bacteroidetes bacterium]|nr:hypothetical protein [Bacteroidota bacterium]